MFSALIDSIYEDGNGLTRAELVYQAQFKSSLLPAQYSFWAVLAGYMTSEWFTRVWTYQEIALAQEAILVHDHRIIAWAVLYRCRAVIREGAPDKLIQAPSHLEDLNGRGRSAVTLWTSIRSEMRPLGPAATTIPLSALIIKGFRRNTTNEEDFVYAMLGLVEEHTRSQLPVDYILPTTQLFVKASQVVLHEKVPNLTFLWEDFDADLPRIGDLPSWCPDFTQAARRPPSAWI